MSTSKTKKAHSPSDSSPRSPSSAAAANYDPVLGKAAFDKSAGRRSALSESALTSRSTDIEACALAVIALASVVAAPALYARFRSLPSAEFDIAHVDDLRELAFATMYAHQQAQIEGALATDAKVPIAVVEEASEVEKRMQRICEHFFADDEALADEVTRLRPGNSRRDLAGDLIGYARIYELRPDVVASDPKYYQATDLAKARELAGKIYASFSASMTPKGRAASDALSRSWTLLNLSYDEVREAGRWLERHSPKGAELFPSLFAVGRPRVGRPKAKAPAAGESKTPDA